jgi:hypothetical protein
MLELLETGKYVYSLHGVVYTNCTRDTDCPFDAQCFLNATWTDFASMCACDGTLTRTGEGCRDINPTGVAMLVMMALTIFVSLVAFVGLVISLNRIIKVTKPGWKNWTTSIHTSSVLLLLAAVSLILNMTFYMCGFLSPLAWQEDGRKTASPWQRPLGDIFVACTFFFETLGLLNISLLWLEVSFSF